MDEDSIGLAVEKREGWSYCLQCRRQAPPGSEIIHQQWCKPYEPTRWERFVKRLDGLRFWEKGSWEVPLELRYRNRAVIFAIGIFIGAMLQWMFGS